MRKRIKELARRAGAAIAPYVPDVVASRAKAIAAFLAPYIAAGVAKLAEVAGVDFNADVGFVQLLIVSLLTGGTVHQVRNRKDAQELDAGMIDPDRRRRHR